MALAVVTGASGLLGSNLSLELLARGHRVRALRRPNSRVDHLNGRPIEWVPGALEDRASLEAAFGGAEVIFHCAAMVSIRGRPTREMIRTNVEGTRNVVEAALRTKVRRLVHCSSAVTIGVSEDGTPCTEANAWNMEAHGLADGYGVTKKKAEELVLEACRAGLDAVIVNPTFMFGPYDAKLSSGKMIVAVVRGQLPGAAPGCNDFVDARDVASGMIAAWEKGRRGERYLLSGTKLTYGEVAALIAKLAQVKAPSRAIPPLLARVAGLAGDLYERVTGREAMVNSSVVRWGFCTGFVFSSEKARRELGYQSRPLESSIRDELEWLRTNGKL